MHTPSRYGSASSMTRVSLVFLGLLSLSPATQAVPSFTRQTGSPCSQCHINSFGTILTPYGRDFKLNGYVWGNNETKLPPVSAMAMGSLTSTQKDQRPDQPGYGPNDNFTFDQASFFYAGRIWDKLGAFAQLTYDGYGRNVFLDNTDIRFANQVELAGQDLTYGLSLNNNPTVQDLWNTTPAWSFPSVKSPYASAPSAAALVEGGLSGRVGGGTLYAMINRLLYLEAGAYGSLSRDLQWGLGTFAPDDPTRISGGAPYWRIALQKDLSGHYFALGTYGLRADLFPGGVTSQGTDSYSDVALDATYQFLGNLDHIFELKSTYIQEDQHLLASRALGRVGNNDNRLDVFRINAAYTFLQTYNLTFGYNKLWGSKDQVANVFDPATRQFERGSPNSEYYVVELSYVPFGKETPTLLSSLMNLRLGLQYTAYSQFNGTQFQAGNYNTLLLNGWLAF